MGIYSCVIFLLEIAIFFYLAITGTRPLFMRKYFFIIYMQSKKSEIQICSNKHETGHVFLG